MQYMLPWAWRPEMNASGRTRYWLFWSGTGLQNPRYSTTRKRASNHNHGVSCQSVAQKQLRTSVPFSVGFRMPWYSDTPRDDNKLGTSYITRHHGPTHTIRVLVGYSVQLNATHYIDVKGLHIQNSLKKGQIRQPQQGNEYVLCWGH
jgi:hypothetical protein